VKRFSSGELLTVCDPRQDSANCPMFCPILLWRDDLRKSPACHRTRGSSTVRASACLRSTSLDDDLPRINQRGLCTERHLQAHTFCRIHDGLAWKSALQTESRTSRFPIMAMPMPSWKTARSSRSRRRQPSVASQLTKAGGAVARRVSRKTSIPERIGESPHEE
jgi:hypothetical protein